MGSRRMLLLLLVCFASATLVSAQPAVQLLRQDGSLADVYLEGTGVVVRVTDLAANTDPGAFENVFVFLAMQLSGDWETRSLTETGTDTGVFEGSMRLNVQATPYVNSGMLDSRPVTNPPQFDEVLVDYNGITDTAGLTGSVTRLLDGEGEEVDELALGSTLQIQVETANDTNSFPFDWREAEVRSLTTGDVETVPLFEQYGTAWTFAGSLPVLPGTATAGDGRMQVQPGETVEVEHLDLNGVTSSSDQAAVFRSAVRFVDEGGRSVAVLAENGTARVQVLDVLSAGQPAPAASAESLLSYDVEPLNLQEVAGSAGLFEGSIPLTAYWSSPSDGLLSTGRDFQEPFSPDTVTALCNGATGSALVAAGILEIVDEQDEPRVSLPVGANLRVRVLAPRKNSSPSAPDAFVADIFSAQGEDHEYLFLNETGNDTSVFLGEIPTRIEDPVHFSDTLAVQSADTIDVSFLIDWYPGGTVMGSIPVVPATVEFLDSEGRTTSSYWLAETLHLRVTDTSSNSDPGSAQSVAVRVEAWRRTNNTPDVEHVSLAESGPDTGIFLGSLPTQGIQSFQYPSWENGVLEQPDGFLLYYDQRTLLSAAWGGESATAVMSDSELWLADGQGQKGTSFPLGSTVHIWLRRPLSNTTSGVDTDHVSVATQMSGQEWITLVETGGDTGLFTAALPTSPPPRTNYDGTLQGAAGELFEVQKSSYGPRSFATGVLTNEPPDAVDDSASTNEDTPVTVAVLANDTDPDGGSLSVTAVSQGTKGSAILGAGGTVTYTPNANANGSDSFTYTVSDGNGGSDTASVAVTIAPVDDPPVALDDTATTPENVAVVIPVLANDSDPDSGDTLSVNSVSIAYGGEAAINPDNTVTFTPSPGFDGGASFAYTLVSSGGGYDLANVTITVTGQNDPPVVTGDAGSNGEDAPIVVSVLDNDSDPELLSLTLAAVTQGAHGTVAITGSQVTYTPAANWFGSDTFTYTAADPGGLSSVGTVNVTVTPMNDPPQLAADTATTAEDTAVIIPVLTNDVDVDGDTLTVVYFTSGALGATITTDGTTINYTPPSNVSGTDAFSYRVRDAGGESADLALVTVTINAVNDPPVAVGDAAGTNEDVAVTISVLTNDSDVDGGTLSVSAVTQGAKGAVTTNGSTVSYTPAANTNGADAFTYTVSDGNGGTASATVTLSVAAVNDAPVAVADSGATREAVAIILAVLANDSDVDGNPLSVTTVGPPANGVATRLADNTVSYTPNPNFTGTDSFSYTVSDGQGGTSNGQVTIAVGEALERVVVLATNSVWLRSGSDVLSGDVIVNQASSGPFLNGGVEVSIGGSVTTAAGWDAEADSLSIAAGATVSGDVSYNQLTNNGTIGGLQRSPLALPVFSVLPTFLAATPGSTNVNVANNGSLTLAAGGYLDLVVGRKGVVTFTGGVYHFRSIQVDREAKLLFTAASEVRVQQKLSTKNLTTVGPATGASIDASSIVFHVGGINGTGGGLAATPKAVEIGSNNTFSANLYAPNGTAWIQDSTLATGALLGKDVEIGLNVQVSLDSAFSGGQ